MFWVWLGYFLLLIFPLWIIILSWFASNKSWPSLAYLASDVPTSWVSGWYLATNSIFDFSISIGWTLWVGLLLFIRESFPLRLSRKFVVSYPFFWATQWVKCLHWCKTPSHSRPLRSVNLTFEWLRRSWSLWSRFEFYFFKFFHYVFIFNSLFWMKKVFHY